MKTVFVYETFTVVIPPEVIAKLNKKERAVIEVLEEANGTKVHQVDIARSKPYLGCHPKYEADLPIRKPNASTLRTIRGLINGLRKKGFPILSEPRVNGGYWYPLGEAEIPNNMTDMQASAIAQSLGFLSTYDHMLKTFSGKVGLGNPFFEKLREFLRTYIPPEDPPQEPPAPQPAPRKPTPPPPSPKRKKPPKDDGQGQLL